MVTNKIYNESCLDTMSRMPEGFIDLTVTSPPYDNLRTYEQGIDETWGESIWKPIIRELYRVTKDGGVVVWIVNDATINGSETCTSFKQAIFAVECGFRLHDTMIWQKNSPPLTHNRYEQHFEYMFVFSKGRPKSFNPIYENRSYVDKRTHKSYRRNKDGNGFDIGFVGSDNKKMICNVWGIRVGYGLVTADTIAHQHPAIFPEKLAADHITSWSNEGDLVYDPFMGSGTTAKMAHILNRKWIGSETSQKYCNLAEKRLQPYLQQTNLYHQ